MTWRRWPRPTPPAASAAGRAPARAAAATLLLPATALAAVGTAPWGHAEAAMAASAASGPQALVAGTLAQVMGLAVGAPSCDPTAMAATRVPLTWTASTALDASNRYIVQGYAVDRAPAASGSYTTVGTVTASPSGSQAPAAFTDVNPPGAPAPTAYVARSGNNAVVRILGTTAGTSAATPGVAAAPDALATTPDGATLVVAESGNGRVVVANGSTTTLAVPGLLPAPAAVTVLPTGTTAYVVDRFNARVYPLTSITAAPALGAAITVAGQGNAPALAVTPDGTKVFVGSSGGTVTVISTATNATTTFTLPGLLPVASDLLVTPDGASLYVLDSTNSRVDVYRAAGPYTAPTTVPVGSQLGSGPSPNAMDVTPDSSTVYVADYGAGATGTVTVIPTATPASTTSINVAGASHADAVKVLPDGCYAFVVDHGVNQVYAIPVVGAARNTVTHTVTVGATSDPGAIAATPDSSLVYVSAQTAGAEDVVDTSSFAVTAVPAAGAAGVVVTPSRYLYEVQATNGAWTGPFSAPVTFTEGTWQVP